MGSNNGITDERPVHVIYLYVFWINQTEVSNKQYAVLVATDKCDSPSRISSQIRDNYYGNSEFDEFPIVM